jgi:hypothetical protein
MEGYVKSLGRLIVCVCLCFFVCPLNPANQLSASGNDAAQGRASVQDLSAVLPAFFVENGGQYADDIRFALRRPGFGISCLDDGVVFQMLRPTRAEESVPSFVSNIKMDFPGANPDFCVRGLEASLGKVNFIKSRDESRGVRGAEVYRTLIYENHRQNHPSSRTVL